MPRNAPYYPGMGDYAAACTDKGAPYIREEPFLVQEPYETVNVAAVPVPALISTEDGLPFFLFRPFEDTLADQGEEGVGWETAAEMEFLAQVREDVLEFIAEADRVGWPHARDAEAMGERAVGLLDDIAAIYDAYRTTEYYALPDGGVGVHTLNEPEYSFIDTLVTYSDYGIQQVVESRQGDRQEIRELWDEAFSLWWCGEVALAKALAYEENRRAYFNVGQERGTEEGASTTTRPLGVPPTRATFHASSIASTPARSVRSDEIASKGGGLVLVGITVGVVYLLSRK